MAVLLAAEADRIQDVIFRSARLREVVGASQLLARFDAEAPAALLAHHGVPPDALLVAAGGGVRAVFPDEAAARRFGADLAELYERAIGGTMTVAEPAPLAAVPDGATEPADTVADDALRTAMAAADAALRLAKRHRPGAASTLHLPHLALCASCGLAPAVAHAAPPGEPAARARYLCDPCRRKARERDDARPGQIRDFLAAVGGGDARGLRGPQDADEVAAADRRGRVAYLLADGNGTGELVGRCGPAALRRLSAALGSVLREALAAAVARLMARLGPADAPLPPGLVPALPLILGGDDLFALLPAPYALDVAREVCLGYAARLGALTAELGGPPPTMAAAVVVCGRSYPFGLAHRRGEALLRRAKRLGRWGAWGGGGRAPRHESTLDFAVVDDGGLAEDPDAADARLTARPYRLLPDRGQAAPAAASGLSLQALLDARRRLAGLAGARAAALEAAFAAFPLERGRAWSGWFDDLEADLDRLGPAAAAAIRSALADLAAPAVGDQRWVRRWDRPGGDTYGHGLPDLLAAWEVAQDLDHPLAAYRRPERLR